MKRIYESLISDNLSKLRQMAFISGPRQVGKTTTAKQVLPNAKYLNYDIGSDAIAIRGGATKIAQAIDLSNPLNAKKGVIFDEIHKFPRWKNLLKGFFDSYADNKIKIAVTGSARLDIYKRGGDSLMGRYFMYRIHPLSARETVSSAVDIEKIFQSPAKISNAQIDKLLAFGGYPEPYLRADKRFYNSWKNLRLEQIFYEDLRDLSRVQDIKGIRSLAELLGGRISSGINYSSLANELNVSSDT
ncbi:MAG: AAA family ATPase, partial [Opitutales bacterium]|nr:AAA family ATPase [Opitutales bacterium]